MLDIAAAMVRLKRRDDWCKEMFDVILAQLRSLPLESLQVIQTDLTNIEVRTKQGRVKFKITKDLGELALCKPRCQPWFFTPPDDVVMNGMFEKLSDEIALAIVEEKHV